MLPIFRNMQRLIDGINRVMREQLSGIRVIRAFAREPFEQNRFARPTRSCRTPPWRSAAGRR